MATVVTATWFPRSYIQLFETYSGLEKTGLNVKDVEYNDEDVSYTITGFKNFPDVRFTQDGSGLHYFTVKLPDEDIGEKADEFMKEMQVILLEKILKACHTVSYKQVVNDQMPLDFHTLILTAGEVDLEGLTVVDAGSLKIAWKPRDIYFGGTVSYVLGTEDESLIPLLLYNSYVEVASDFLANMMKAMIRLYHAADQAVEDVDAAQDQPAISEVVKSLEELTDEAASRYGRMRHFILNLDRNEAEYRSLKLMGQDRELAEAFEFDGCFRRLRSDAEYMEVLWSNMMEGKIRNLYPTVKMRLKLKRRKKGWFNFGIRL